MQPAFKFKTTELAGAWLTLNKVNAGDAVNSPIVHRQRLDCELIVDLDNQDYKLNVARGLQIQDYLASKFGMVSELFVTGGKGTHLHSFIKGGHRRHAVGIFNEVSRAFRTKIDAGVMLDKTHMIRGEWGLYKDGIHFKVPFKQLTNADYVPLVPINILDEGVLAHLAWTTPLNYPERAKRTWYSKKGEN